MGTPLVSGKNRYTDSVIRNTQQAKRTKTPHCMDSKLPVKASPIPLHTHVAANLRGGLYKHACSYPALHQHIILCMMSQGVVCTFSAQSMLRYV